MRKWCYIQSSNIDIISGLRELFKQKIFKSMVKFIGALEILESCVD